MQSRIKPLWFLLLTTRWLPHMSIVFLPQTPFPITPNLVLIACTPDPHSLDYLFSFFFLCKVLSCSADISECSPSNLFVLCLTLDCFHCYDSWLPALVILPRLLGYTLYCLTPALTLYLPPVLPWIYLLLMIDP